MSKKKARRSRATPKGQRPISREDVLRRVTLCLMEAVVNDRIGQGRVMSGKSDELMQASVASWARTDEEREDLTIQASELARSTVDTQWPSIEPLVRSRGAVVFRDAATLSGDVLDRPLQQMPEPIAGSSGSPPWHIATIHHRVAHGVVAAVTYDSPASVGFSDFRVPDAVPDSRHMHAVLYAGSIHDTIWADQHPGFIRPEEGACECPRLAASCLLDVLGIEASDFDAAEGGTVEERMSSLGRLQDVHGHEKVPTYGQQEVPTPRPILTSG